MIRPDFNVLLQDVIRGTNNVVSTSRRRLHVIFAWHRAERHAPAMHLEYVLKKVFRPDILTSISEALKFARSYAEIVLSDSVSQTGDANGRYVRHSLTPQREASTGQDGNAEQGRSRSELGRHRAEYGGSQRIQPVSSLD